MFFVPGTGKMNLSFFKCYKYYGHTCLFCLLKLHVYILPLTYCRSLQKQLVIAREARRVDVLCERLSLSHKMVKGSERYKEIASLISSAVKILEKEVGGALDQVSVIMGRGIVNRLTCGAEVQKLCSSALEIVDSTVDNILEFESNNSPKLLGNIVL